MFQNPQGVRTDDDDDGNDGKQGVGDELFPHSSLAQMQARFGGNFVQWIGRQ